MNGVLGYLGLGIRAGSVVVGVDAVRRSLQAREVRCIVVARDASQRAREKVVRLAAALQPLAAGVEVDLPPGQLGGEPHVLAVAADGEGKLVLVHDGLDRLCLGHREHLGDAGRGQSQAREPLRVG